MGTLLVLQFVALCVMTRVARGWMMTCAGFALYAVLYGAFLWGVRAARLSSLAQLQLGCSVLWIPLVALMLVLSRDDRWRTLFVALDYVAYVTAILPVSHALAFCKVTVLGGGGWICSLILLAAAHALFLFVLLPLVPRSSDRLPWRIGSLAAFMLFVLLYATGVWPHSLVTGGWQEWTAFLVASAVAWVVFPMMYAGLRSYLHNLGIERDLAQMVAEVAVRREAIDAARRQRHDSRHHRIVLAEHLLRGQVDRALAYLEQLDNEASETPTDKFIWCENDTINAILSGLSRRAKAKGVAFEVTANVERAVNVPDIDLVAVVANLVENAVNAAGEKVERRGGGGQRSLAFSAPSALTSDEDVASPIADVPRGEATSTSSPRVTVALRQRERTIGMTVTNPVPDGFALFENGLPCEEPGVGLESVRRVIERHHGELVYTLGEGVLECQAMMRIGHKSSIWRVA